MPTMIFGYSPKPGVSAADFERFVFEVDQPATLALPSALSSRILRIEDAGAPFAYLEILEITSFEDWERDSKRPEVQQIVAQWPTYGDMANMKVYKGVQAFSAKSKKK